MKNRRLLCLLLLPFLFACAATRPDEVQPVVNANIPYRQIDGQTLLLDVYSPASRAGSPRPALILLYGGGWASGAKEEMADLARYFAGQDFVCLAINYRPAWAQGNKYPAQLEDAQQAVTWLRQHADTYHVDPNAVGALGYSAGGHLASLLGVAPPPAGVQAVVNIYGPSDLTASFPQETTEIISHFMGGPAQDLPEQYRQASPAWRITEQTAPFLIFHGDADAVVPVEQSRTFHQKLRQASVDATYIEFPGEGHGFSQPDNVETFLRESVKFLNQHLRRQK